MIRGEMSSIDFVEVVMAIEEGLEIEIPDVDAVAFGGPRDIVDWLEPRLIGKRINQQTALLLENLARQQGTLELAGTLGGTWRREQITAVVQEILRVHALDDWSDPADPDASVRVPLKPKPHPRSGAASVFPKEQL